MKRKRVIIIGGGAAGFFAAINHAERFPENEVIILEKSQQVLAKVAISGGGRCNVTHACFEPRELVKFYPRGEKALQGPFSRFQPADTVAWFESRGVQLKTEADNRMFPTTDSSQTIVDCFVQSAARAGVRIITRTGVEKLTPATASNGIWQVHTSDGQILEAHCVLLASGSSPKTWEIPVQLGHTLVPPVPSLFTFNIKDPRLEDLLGLSVPHAVVKVAGSKLQTEGPLLITHWGMSGPAILRLSAWGARELHDQQYKFTLLVNWLPALHEQAVIDALGNLRKAEPRKQVAAHAQFNLPVRLWKRLVAHAAIKDDMRWADLPNKAMHALAAELSRGSFTVNGKSTFKDEFVTAGGISLKEVDFKTMQSKLHPSLFFAGETLDIDAITGGFNFQAAWTTGWIAAQAMGEV